MRRASLALAGALSLLLVLAPVVDAAASGARPPIAVGQTVSDVALAANGNRFAASNSDPGSRFTGNPSASTWTLWNMDGSTRATGGADPTICPNPTTAPTEDCDTDALKIALSANGAKLAVAGRISMGGDSTLTVFSDGGSRFNQVTVPGAVQDIAIDPLGERVAAVSIVATDSPANPEDGFIGLWTADSSMSVLIEQDNLPLGVTSVDLTREILVAGAGNTHYLFTVPQNSAYSGSSISGNVLDVDAAATHPTGWSAAGYSSGFFALFSDRTTSGHNQPSVPDYQKREAGETSPVNAVAIRDDATAFAVGHEAGRLRLYSLNPETGLPGETAVSMMAERAGLGSIDDLAFSGDGRYLAVRSDGTVRLYYTGGGALDEMWTDTRSSVADSLDIDGDGDHVAIASGSSVIVYDAIHSIAPTLPSASQQPGTTRTYDLAYRNNGNRAEALSLQAQPPSGVTVSLSPTDFTLLPGASRTVQATVTVPATWAPGSLPVPMRLSINGGADGTPTTNLALTVPTVHKVALTAPDGDNKGADAGAPATFKVNVANQGNAGETVALTLSGLNGWTGDVEPSSVTLAPGDDEDVTVTLQPPAGAADGTTLLVQLRGSVAGTQPLELRATVGANFAVRLTGPAGITLNPGVNGVLQLTVRNDGNTVDDVLVTMPTLPTGWLGGFAGGQAETQLSDLAVGESRTVEATVRAPADAVSEVPTQLTFRAQSLGDAARTADARVLFTVESPTSTTTADDGEGGGGNGIPGPSPLLLAAALAAAALVLRRR